MKADSLRSRRAIARFGKSARHPLCLAALALWRQDAELFASTKDVVRFEEAIKDAKHRKERVQVLIKQFREEQEKEASLIKQLHKGKEVKQASVLLRENDKFLQEAQTYYQLAVKVRSTHQECRRVAMARFESECDAVIRTGDMKARRALQRVRKRWNDKGAFLRDGDRRTLEMLKMLHDKGISAVEAKDGPAAGYFEAARGGDRALSDEFWKGRLTAREIQSRLVDAPGDRQAKEVRRLARKLGILLADDQRGRKRKPYLPQQLRKAKRICPECMRHDLEPRKRLCRYCAIRAKILWGTSLKAVSQPIKAADAIQASSHKTPWRGDKYYFRGQAE